MTTQIARSQWMLCAAVLLSTSVAFAAEGEFHRTLKVSGPVNLQIETGAGSIQVHNGGSSEVLVTGHIRPSNWGVFGEHASPEAIQRLQDTPPIQQSGNDI